MIVLSPRYAVPALLLLFASALPVWLHATAAPTVEDCADARAFFGAREIGAGRALPPSPGVSQLERVDVRIDHPNGNVVGRVVRTFDPRSVYASPAHLGFDGTLYLGQEELRRVEAGDVVLPVHWSSEEGAESLLRIEAWLYVLGGRPVWHPLPAGISLAWPQLLEGTRPLWVFIVSAAGARHDRAGLEGVAEQWLVDAWRRLEATCAF